MNIAFTKGAFSAYAKLGRMRWASEAVDVYASNIQRLAELARFEGSGQDQIMKLTFVNGFLGKNSVALKPLPNMKMLEISELILTARMLTVKRTQELAAAAKPGIREKKAG